jgi:hypothetical protein
VQQRSATPHAPHAPRVVPVKRMRCAVLRGGGEGKSARGSKNGRLKMSKNDTQMSSFVFAALLQQRRRASGMREVTGSIPVWPLKRELLCSNMNKRF